MKKVLCLVCLTLFLTACGEEQKAPPQVTAPAPKPAEKAAQKMTETAETVKETAQQTTQKVAEKTEAVKSEAKQMVEKAETKVAALAGSLEVGKTVYQANCGACHNNGVMGAPKLGDERLLGELEALYKNSINGIGRMPAKGGVSALSDDKVRAAVDYMVEQSR
jgi:cytochrome c5